MEVNRSQDHRPVSGLRNHLRRPLALAGAAILALFAHESHAALLDWDNQTWTTANGQTRSFDIDGDSLNDVQIAFSGDTGTMTGQSSPTISGGIGGGLGNALRIAVDWSNTTQNLVCTITFLNKYAGGVHASFVLADIDTGTWEDQIRNIQGHGVGAGATDFSITPSLSVPSGSNVNLTGATFTGTQSVNSTTAAGNAQINFGGIGVDQIRFTYGNGANANSNPGSQVIFLSDINFSSSTPEVAPSLGALTACALAVGCFRFRQNAATA